MNNIFTPKPKEKLTLSMAKEGRWSFDISEALYYKKRLIRDKESIVAQWYIIILILLHF